MGSTLAGFLLLLLAIAALAGAWLIVLRDKDKEIESAPVFDARASETSSITPKRNYSLAPEPKHQAASTPLQAVEVKPASNVMVPPTPEAAVEPVEADDETARLHIDLARQFFDMGDFEGAQEMCKLVADNANASKAQQASAADLYQACA